MRIQRNELNNIIKNKHVKLNPKKLSNNFDSPSFKQSYYLKKEECSCRIDEDNKDSVLDKGCQINNLFNESKGDTISKINEETSKGNKNHYTLFQNIFLVNSLNLNRNHNIQNNIKISEKNNNFRKHNNFEKHLTNNINKKTGNYRFKNSTINENLNHSEKIVKIPLKKVREIMKYITQSSNFHDLNLRPSNEKSWLFNSEKKRPKTSSKQVRHNIKNIEHKKIIHKIHSNERINKFKCKSIDNENFKNKNIKSNKNNNLNFFINYNQMSSNINLYKNKKEKKDKIILFHNNINRKKMHSSIKSNYISKMNDMNRVNKNYMNKKQTPKNYRLNSCRINNCHRRKILINNHKENKTLYHNSDNKKCDLKVNIISNVFPSFDKSGNRDNNFAFINSIFH
jgi:hypothetical protein